MKTAFRKIVFPLLLALLVGVVAFSTGKAIAEKHPQAREAAMMCVRGMVGVYTKPDDKAQVFYALYDRAPIWWNGVRKGNWLWVDFEFGSGWIKTDDLEQCSPEPPADWNPLWHDTEWAG